MKKITEKRFELTRHKAIEFCWRWKEWIL